MNKILVALSGGVDSSTAAALLKEQGFSVAGATMIFKGVQEEDIDHARRSCELLGIKFFTFNFTKIYQQEILDNFLREYKNGRTPNPCVMCNQLIKFGVFMQRCRELGYEKMATGHYARIEKDKDLYLLKQGRDRNEQSYFLYRLNQDQLSKIILPLGEYTKNEVRKIAGKIKLPTANRKKSQDICFLPDGDYGKYLSGILPVNPGPIFDSSGKKIGVHKGIVFYTYGQRRGMGISHERPYYVTRIDAKENAIYVGEKEQVCQRELVAGSINFIYDFDFHAPLKVKAKPRYFAPLADATIEPCHPASSPRQDASSQIRQFVCRTKQSHDDPAAIASVTKIKVIFDQPQWALTPGQSVVLYDGDTVLGGGVIEQVVGSNLHT